MSSVERKDFDQQALQALKAWGVDWESRSTDSTPPVSSSSQGRVFTTPDGIKMIAVDASQAEALATADICARSSVIGARPNRNSTRRTRIV